uniref:Aminotransferase-like plant mobile domain-containing protein n=1 Tax=Fagus sylvatica TaxID=28930 RepID=A0A2N9GIH8_FAGSY
MAPGSRGAGAVFVCFSGEDSGQTGDATGEPRVPRRSWSRHLSNAPGLADQLVSESERLCARRRLSGRKNAFYSQRLALPTSCKVPDLRESELGLVRYGPANRGHRSVFGPFGGHFSDRRFRLDRVKAWRSESCTSCMHVSSFQRTQASRINFVASQEDSARKRGNVGGKSSGIFSTALFPSACFRVRGRRSSRYRISTILVSSESLCYLLFKVRLDLRASPFGVQMDILRVEKDRAGDEEAVRGSKGRVGAEDPDRRSVFAYASYRSQIGDDLALGDHPSLKSDNVTVWILKSKHVGDDLAWVTTQMSGRGSGSGGQRRSDRLAKGKAVAYEPESSPDTDDEYDAMEDVRTRADASIARNLQAELDAEAAGLASGATRPPRPPSRPGIVIGRSARPSSAPRRSTVTPTVAPPARSKRQRSDRTPLSTDPVLEDYAAPGFRYPPRGGIRPRYPVTTPVADTPLLTGLHDHPSSSVIRCEDPPASIGRGGWSDFCQLLEIARPEYRDFLAELGFGPFLSIRYVHVWHPLVRCWVERFFHHTGTIHLSTCVIGVLPVDWSAILGIRFGGRIPPSDPVPDFEALEILGIADLAAVVGKNLPSLRINYLRDLLRREIEEPPTELRYRQWVVYFIFSCFFGNDKSTVPTPIVGMFRDIDALRDYDWGALTYGFYIRGLRRFSRRQTASFLGFWQFTLFWAFEHFPVFAPSRLPAAPDSVFPLARRWDSAWIRRLTIRTLMECRTTMDCIRDIDIVFQPYSSLLVERPRGIQGRGVVLSADMDSISKVLGALDGREDHAADGWSRVVGSWAGRPWTAMSSSLLGSAGGDGPYADGGDLARWRDGPDAGGLGPEAEGLGLSGCRVGHSGCDHPEIRGLASGCRHSPRYWSWLVWFRSDFFSATS